MKKQTKQTKYEKFVKAIKEAEKRAKQFTEHCEAQGLELIDMFILFKEQQKNKNKQQSVYEKTDSQEANGWQRMEVRFGARKNKRKKAK